MPKTTITFEGLLVFRPDPDNSLCEVGVLRARVPPDPQEPSHILQIEVDPNPQTGTGKLIKDPAELESFITTGHVSWNLDVSLNGQQLQELDVNTGIPPDRKTPTFQNRQDFGWIINIESLEFHNGPLERTRGQLMPVISLTNGRLFTACLTDSIDKKQGQNTCSNCGFIAGTISLEIDTSRGEVPVLYFMDQQRPHEIFSLQNTNQRDYKISIKNTPLAGGGGHFHLFYDILFRHVGMDERFDILRHFPVVSPAGDLRCQVEPAPDPFKCGGVSVGGSGSLST